MEVSTLDYSGQKGSYLQELSEAIEMLVEPERNLTHNELIKLAIKDIIYWTPRETDTFTYNDVCKIINKAVSLARGDTIKSLDEVIDLHTREDDFSTADVLMKLKNKLELEWNL